jgi:hypothetical protein
MTDTPPPTVKTRSNLSRRWLGRMVFISLFLLGFGAWGYYDATVAYPKRGRSYAEYRQLEYLRQAQRSGRLFESAVFDPEGELERLSERGVLDLTELERTRREWLEALAVPGIGLLTPEHTRMDDPPAELERLEDKFSTQQPGKALSNYDIPMQWVICGVCWGIALYLIVLVSRVRARVYTFDPEVPAITPPGGPAITPADLDPDDPADLSRWNKFIITLRPNPAGGAIRGPVRFDVFRHEPVEDWLRTIIKRANPEIEFPDEAKARLEAERAAASAAAEDAPDAEAGEAGPDGQDGPDKPQTGA